MVWHDIDSGSLQVIVDDHAQYRCCVRHVHECLAHQIPRTDGFECGEAVVVRQDHHQGLFNEKMELQVWHPSFTAAERFWSPNYIQHSAHIEPGREGLFNLIKSLPPTLKYEPGTIVAEGDFVIVHGRFSGFGQPVNWIAADILRIENWILVEHWDVIQDEATRESSKSGLPMFGEKFGRSLQSNSKPQRRET